MSLIYGINTSYEVLRGNQKIYQVMVSKQFKDEKILSYCKNNHINITRVDVKELNKQVGKVNHQGIVVNVEDYQYYSIDEVINAVPAGKQPMLLMLDGLEDPHNLGAILRTCDAVGVDGVIIKKNRNVTLNATVAKTSTGAIDHVKVAQVTNLSRTIEQLKDRGYWIVGCDNDESVDYRTVDYNMPVVLVIGSEGAGISRLVKEKCDFHVVIPMVGHVTSLNASVAAAVLLYQVYQSRNPI